MLQGFLNESAILEIERGQYTDPIRKVLQETTQLLNMEPIHEGVNVDNIKEKINHLIEVVMEFFKKLYARITTKTNKVEELVAEVKKTETQLQLPQGKVDREFPIIVPPPGLMGLFEKRSSDVLTQSEHLSGDWSEKYIYDSIAKRLQFDEIDSIISKLEPRTYRITAGRSAIILNVIDTASKELRLVKVSGDRLIRDLKSLTKDSDLKSRYMIYHVASKALMELQVKYTTAWLKILVTAENALVQYNRWMKTQLTLNDSVTVYDVTDVYAINESIGIDSILNESIQALNEGVSAEAIKEKIKRIIDTLVQFFKRIGDMIRQKLSRGKSLIKEVDKNENSIKLLPAPDTKRWDDAQHRVNNPVHSTSTSTIHARGDVQARLPEPRKVEPLTVKAKVWKLGANLRVIGNQYAAILVDLESDIKEYIQNKRQQPMGKMDPYYFPGQGRRFNNAQEYKESVLNYRFDEEIVMTPNQVKMVKEEIQHTMNAMESADSEQYRILQRLKSLTSDSADPNTVARANQAATAVMNVYHATIELLTVKYNDYMHILNAYNNHLKGQL